MTSQQLILKHGGYRKLRTFQMARLIFDITIRLSFPRYGNSVKQIESFPR